MGWETAITAGATLLSGAMSDSGGGGASGALQQYRPVGFSAPGGSTRFDPIGYRLDFSRGEPVDRALNELRNLRLGQASDLRQMRPLVAPGVGELTRTRVQALRAARTRTMGNLREALAKRRVLGSGFAQAELARAEQEFAFQEQQVAAESFLQEFGLTRDLINQETEAAIAASTQSLTQLNFESGLAAGMANAASSAMQANAQAQAQVLAAQQGGQMELLGTLVGIAAGSGSPFGGGGGAVGPSSPSPQPTLFSRGFV